MASKRLCLFCGSELHPTGLRGRPRDYCADGRHCKSAEYALQTVEKMARKIQRYDPKRATLMRRRLWSLANELNKIGRPQKAKA